MFSNWFKLHTFFVCFIDAPVITIMTRKKMFKTMDWPLTRRKSKSITVIHDPDNVLSRSSSSNRFLKFSILQN